LIARRIFSPSVAMFVSFEYLGQGVGIVTAELVATASPALKVMVSLRSIYWFMYWLHPESIRQATGSKAMRSLVIMRLNVLRD
jgi:hypothetical protein